MNQLKLITLLLSIPIVGLSQHKFQLQGKVLDEQNLPLPGCHVHFGEVCAVTNQNGEFVIDDVHEGERSFLFTFVGYHPIDTLVEVSHESTLIIQMQECVSHLHEVGIKVKSYDTLKTHKNELISSEFMAKNLSGTFIKSLDKLPGINSMNVGANISKPVIRGMGFNRVIVSENGIKQENQQWGADHGIEIDPFAIETAEIIKGASPVEFGSDALGGVVKIDNNELPVNGKVQTEFALLGKTVNSLFGGSVKVQQRKNKFFYKLRTSALNFGDYNVPTDTIVYLTRKIPIHDNRLKNTAGTEYSVNGQFGFISTHTKHVLSVSNVNQQSGFFPGAHGIPSEDKIQDDGDQRNIDYPYQQVNHFKISDNFRWFMHDHTLNIDAGFQNNNRKEFSEFHTHYPGQSKPEQDENLEIGLKLNTYALNVKLVREQWNNHEFVLGVQNQYMLNRVSGYSYFLPDYNRFTTGVFVKDEWSVNDGLKLVGGVRFDYGMYDGKAFFDSLVYNFVKVLPNRTEEEAKYYAQRSFEVNRTYPGISWHFGLIQSINELVYIRANFGKAFRIPTAVELGANGVHHGSYRFEIGDPNIERETGYFADLNSELRLEKTNLSVGGYAYYFTNYIYLQPTGDLSHPIPDAGGLYYYTQSKALVSGFELSLNQKILKRFNFVANVEAPYNYLVNPNGNLGYGIPYSPAINGYNELEYAVGNATFSINHKWSLKKDKSIGQGEIATPSFNDWGLNVSWNTSIKDRPVVLVFKVQNMLNTKYFNHMSYYRKLNIPEQGRNFQLLIKLPIN